MGKAEDWTYDKLMDDSYPASNTLIAAFISRRRRQLIVHSVIYYKLGESIIGDYDWSIWARQLVDVQNKYPKIAKTCPYAEAFEGFDGSTGMDLPLDDPWAVKKAHELLRMYGRE